MSGEVQGWGGFRDGTISGGECQFSVLVPEFSPFYFCPQFGISAAPRAPSLAAVAWYRCAVVGSPPVRHVRPSYLPEKLVVVENVCELGSSPKKAAGFDTRGCSSFPHLMSPHQNWRCAEIFRERNLPPEMFCGIRDMSCPAGRRPTVFFCRGVPVPVYCMSRSVCMLAPSDMPLASGRATGAQSQSAPYQRPLSNTRPPHHQNSVGTCCVRRVAQ